MTASHNAIAKNATPPMLKHRDNPMKKNQRKCLNGKCKKKFTPLTNTQLVCSYQCAITIAKKTIKYQHQQKKKKWKEQTQTLSYLKKKARIVFQKYIRLRDSQHPCISCGNKNASIYHAGHYLKAELFPKLIFDETNCHKQCIQCNYFKDGNELGYRDGLIKRFGLDYILTLEAKKNNSRNYKFTKTELHQIRKLYSHKILTQNV